MKFDRNNLDEIRADINAALESVAEKHGITLSIGNISYESTRFTTKLTAQTGDGSEHEQKEFARNCWRYNIPESWYGKSFVAEGQTFTITGINTRARKSPINFKDVKGRMYKASPEYVKAFMKKDA